MKKSIILFFITLLLLVKMTGPAIIAQESIISQDSKRIVIKAGEGSYQDYIKTGEVKEFFIEKDIRIGRHILWRLSGC